MNCGAGVAPVFPLTVSAAAAMSDGAPEANVAAASFVAFAVFLITPPLVGGLTDLFGLRTAFFLLVPGLSLTALLIGVVRLPRANGDRN